MTNNSRVELLSFDGCPNADQARQNLRAALEAAGLELAWREWDLESEETPQQLRRFGSPTVLVEGVDVTGVGPGAVAAVACRADGAPSVAVIVSQLGGA